MIVPGDYIQGHAKARQVDAVLADRYVHYTTVGDPEVDEMLLELDTKYSDRKQEWIQRGIEGGPMAIPEAPLLVRDLFARMEQVPVWWESDNALPGCRAFHRHSQMFLGAFVGAVLIEGFSTLISKSFSITGRLVDQGVRRLKQNNRHLIEIFMPGGLDRHADGWKLSVRIRLVHAQVRRMLESSPEWEREAWGTALSASHLAYATAAFSGLLLKRARMLGVYPSLEERASFMQIWRYSGHLMGVMPELLFATEDEALRFQQIGFMCEPPPGLESCQLANGLINAAPIVAGVEEPRARAKLVKKIYRISRALIGNEMADQLNYPPSSVFGVLPLLRFTNHLDHFLQKWNPAIARKRQSGQFMQMLDLSHYEQKGMAYRVPEHIHAEKDKPL